MVGTIKSNLQPVGTYLPQEEEDAFHNTLRLLAVEQRPYQRIATHLKAAGIAKVRSNFEEEQDARWRNEQLNGINDIVIFNSTIARMEGTAISNREERERYATEKIGITESAQGVRDNITALQQELKDAEASKELRMRYDKHAEKIFNNKMLKPRGEQHEAHKRLDNEIEELKEAIETSQVTFEQRFERIRGIIQESRELLQEITDEKEEVERKEGMLKDDDGEADGSTTKGDVSRIGTPRPDAANTPTPNDLDGEVVHTLQVPQHRLAPISRPTSAAQSPSNTAEEDAVMAEAGDADDSSEMEEGEEQETPEAVGT